MYLEALGATQLAFVFSCSCLPRMRCLFTPSTSSRDGRASLAFTRQGAQPVVEKADALCRLAVIMNLILPTLLQMWGAFNFRIKVDFLRVVPDPKARLAGASHALLEATSTSVLQ